MKVRLNTVLYVLLIMLFSFAVISSADWSKFARGNVLVVSIPSLCILIGLLLTSIIRKKEKLVTISRAEISTALWMVGIIVGILLLGAKITLTAFMVIYVKKVQGKSWLATGIFTAVMLVIIFVGFEALLVPRWPEGMILKALGLKLPF